jgi:diguanylate cyclase (GGDEF)-like protein
MAIITNYNNDQLSFSQAKTISADDIINGAEAHFSRLARLVTRLINIPYACISLLDENSQWLTPIANSNKLSIHQYHPLFSQVLLHDQTLIIEQLSLSDHAHSPLAFNTSSQCEFYAGFPLISSNNTVIGKLSVMDIQTRQLTPQDIDALTDLTALIVSTMRPQQATTDTHSLQTQLQHAKAVLCENERLNRLRNSILDRIVNSHSLTPILATIVKSIEVEYPEMLCSILLLDEKGNYLQSAAAPSLPDFYNEAIDGLEIGPEVGSCGAAAYTRQRVIAEDISTHPNWAGFCELAAKAKLGSCWSEPIKNSNGAVLGTFAIYHPQPCVPGDNDFKLIEQFAYLASIAIERQRNSELIWQQANFDELTGLPNRNLMAEHLQLALSTARRKQTKVAVAFLDLDNFKDINDTMGHGAGDELLIESTRRIKSCVRATDTVARLGGDEFIIIVPDINGRHDLDRMTKALISSLAEPYQVQNETAYSSASIGITLYPDDAEIATDLLKNADQAMYGAKSEGRNRCHFYTEGMRDSAIQRKLLTNDLYNAIEEEQFFLVFQPIVDLVTGKIIKAEALIRWLHPERGLVGPMQFIPLAEESGQIIDISNWIFHKVCRQVRDWRERYCDTLQISINTSPLHYSHPERNITQWLGWMKDSATPADAILLEITEHLLMESRSSVADKLFQFSQAGVEIALDDFGTGYSSISYLKKYPTNYVKIDKSFVDNMTANSNDLALCEAIVVMAKRLGLKVVAEGIETQQQQQLLAEMGCDYGQGYYLSKPLSEEDFEALLKQQQS